MESHGEEESSRYKLKVLRTDNGGEFTSTEFQEYLQQEGIKHELTVPKTPEQNGVAERMNRTLVETTRSMLFGAKLPQRFWAEALSTAVYLRNRSPTKAVKNITPYEAWFGEKPRVDHLRVFGSTVYAHIPKDERGKLDSKAQKCVLLGYGSETKGYRLYDQTKKRVFLSRDVIFNEQEVNGLSDESLNSEEPLPLVEVQLPSLETSNDESTKETEAECEEPPDAQRVETPIARQSERVRQRPDYYGVWVKCVEQLDPEPTSVTEALSCPEKEEWKKAMNSEMESISDNKVKDLGELKYFLGVNVIQNRHKGNLWLGQQTYTEKFGFDNAKSISSAVDVGTKLTKATDSSELVDPSLYQSAVGSLLYLATKTRPDISFAVGSVARYCSKPTREHWTAVKRIFRYLKGTSSLGLLYQPQSSRKLIGYSDADWGGDGYDYKSTSGFCFEIGGTLVSWRSRKQPCVALSTTEAEYIALASTGQEAVWLQELYQQLDSEQTGPTLIYEDNQSTIAMSKNPQFHGRAKHIGIKFHFIREQVANKKVELKYCRTDEMLADMFTKGLGTMKFVKLRELIGLKDQTACSEEEC